MKVHYRYTLLFLWFSLGFSLSSVSQIILQSTIVDQCNDTIYTNLALVKSDSSLHIFQDNMICLLIQPEQAPLYYYDHLSQLPFTKKTVNDTIRDTLFLPQLTLQRLISNPPMSWYAMCEEKAQGEITDYYCDKRPRMSGVFIDGQPVDTVFTYFYTGSIHSWSYGENNQNLAQEFYENGSLKWSFNGSQGRSEKRNYSSGYIMTESYITKLGGLCTKDYYENGILKAYKNNWESSRYASDGTIVSKVQIASIGKRIFTRTNCNYELVQHDTITHNLCTVKFKANSNTDFLDMETISDIGYYDFESAVVQQNNKKSHKIVKEYKRIKDSYQYVFGLFTRSRYRWVHSKNLPYSEVEKTILDLMSLK